MTGLSIGYYSSEDGLPNKYVADITQDDYGFMWIATRNGLENMQQRAATIQGTLSILASANEFEVVMKRKEI